MLGITGVAAVFAVSFLVVNLKSDEKKEQPVALVSGPGLGLGLAGSF